MHLIYSFKLLPTKLMSFTAPHSLKMLIFRSKSSICQRCHNRDAPVNSTKEDAEMTHLSNYEALSHIEEKPPMCKHQCTTCLSNYKAILHIERKHPTSKPL